MLNKYTHWLVGLAVAFFSVSTMALEIGRGNHLVYLSQTNKLDGTHSMDAVVQRLENSAGPAREIRERITDVPYVIHPIAFPVVYDSADRAKTAFNGYISGEVDTLARIAHNKILELDAGAAFITINQEMKVKNGGTGGVDTRVATLNIHVKADGAFINAGVTLSPASMNKVLVATYEQKAVSEELPNEYARPASGKLRFQIARLTKTGLIFEGSPWYLDVSGKYDLSGCNTENDLGAASSSNCSTQVKVKQMFDDVLLNELNRKSLDTVVVDYVNAVEPCYVPADQPFAACGSAGTNPETDEYVPRMAFSYTKRLRKNCQFVNEGITGFDTTFKTDRYVADIESQEPIFLGFKEEYGLSGSNTFRYEKNILGNGALDPQTHRDSQLREDSLIHPIKPQHIIHYKNEKLNEIPVEFFRQVAPIRSMELIDYVSGFNVDRHPFGSSVDFILSLGGPKAKDAGWVTFEGQFYVDDIRDIKRASLDSITHNYDYEVIVNGHTVRKGNGFDKSNCFLAAYEDDPRCEDFDYDTDFRYIQNRLGSLNTEEFKSVSIKPYLLSNAMNSIQFKHRSVNQQNCYKNKSDACKGRVEALFKIHGERDLFCKNRGPVL